MRNEYGAPTTCGSIHTTHRLFLVNWPQILATFEEQFKTPIFIPQCHRWSKEMQRSIEGLCCQVSSQVDYNRAVRFFDSERNGWVVCSVTKNSWMLKFKTKWIPYELSECRQQEGSCLAFQIITLVPLNSCETSWQPHGTCSAFSLMTIMYHTR
jgi:hypothetical protein